MAYLTWKGYDNVIAWQLKREGAIQPLTAVTKVAIHFLGNEYNSDRFPLAFDYTTDADIGVVYFKSNEIPNIEAGSDDTTELIVFDPSNPNGIVWGTFNLTILEIEAVEVT